MLQRIAPGAAKLCGTIALAGLALSNCLSAGMVPFVIPANTNPDSVIAFKTLPVSTSSAHVTVAGGRFMEGDKRLRIWGVNTCFGANFPAHEDAEGIAVRMGTAGINSVRFHHMDTARYPSGILSPADPLKLDPEALDRLDYFVSRLAANGIYANINLHVGRQTCKALKLPDSGTEFDKMVDIFTPELIAAQKQYATDLLTHVNKYRGLRYADDPAVAFVEITNEDSLFMWNSARDLAALPEFYAAILRRNYTDWLKRKYGTTDALRTAWSQGALPPGPNILTEQTPVPAKADTTVPGWRLEQHEGNSALLSAGAPGVLRIDVDRTNGPNWHIQIKQTNLALRQGQYYTLSFRARATAQADSTMKLGYTVMQDHTPWQNLGLNGAAKLTSDWQPFRAGFTATAGDDAARLAFHAGGRTGSMEICDISLAAGGITGLEQGESLEKTNIVLFSDFHTGARTTDRFHFLADTEKAYFDEMKRFLKDDLKVKACITGTMAFGPLGLYGQSGLDYIDGHAYWQHPLFPHKQWDREDWVVNRMALADSPGDPILSRLAAERMAGKPFTISEYNHSAPNDFQAECVPVIAAYAAAQDWDGVWIFAYSHRTGKVDKDFFDSFFDIDANPAKWGFIRAGAAIFRSGAIEPHRSIVEVAPGPKPDLFDWLTKQQLRYGFDLLGSQRTGSGSDADPTLKARYMHNLFGPGNPDWNKAEGGPEFLWKTNSAGKGIFSAKGQGAIVLVNNAYKDEGGVPSQIEISAPDFAVVTMTALDGKPLDQSSTLLIAACGRCENPGMVFAKDRRTVGTNWGKGPASIEPVNATLQLPAGQWSCHALKPDGTRGAKVSTGSGTLKLSAAHGTMWYLAELRARDRTAP